MVSIPFLKGTKKKSHGEVYIGVFFKELEGVVMYLEDGETGLKIVGTEPFRYSNGWEGLVDDIDETLYRLETKTKIAPQKAIFFIYSHFVDEEHKEIKRPFLAKIKEISKSLDLKPLGYIECQEAIIEHLRAREHAPLHMVLLEFDKTVVTLALYQGGTNIHQRTVARTGDVVNTLNPIFQELKQKYVLPNRLILYDEKSLTNDVSTLLANRWDEDVFSTPPKLDILTQEELHKSLVDVFAKQIHTGSAVPEPDEHITAMAAAKPRHQETVPEEEGFVIGGTAEPVADTTGVSNIKENPADVMGFMIGDETDSAEPAGFRFTDEEPVPASKSKKKRKNPLAAFKMLKFSMPKGNVVAFVGVAILLIVLAGLGGAEYFLHKAQVTVTIPATPLRKDITIGSEVPIDEGKDSRSVQATAQTTGSKQIGEKAKGSVTIYNSSLQQSQTLSKGTKLTGPNNLAFVLSDDVKVASASGDASDIKSSTTKVSVVAAEIGTEYNIGGDTKLAIDGESASTVIAKTDGTFSGGSKKQVRVASATDITKLRTKVSEDAKKDAASTVKSKAGSGNVVVEDLTEVTLKDEKLSKKAGDEAESISLTATAQTTFYTFDESKLKTTFAGILSKGIPKGTKVQPETVSYRITKLEGKDAKDRKVSFVVESKAVPVFDRAKLISQLSGKPVAGLDKMVKEGYRAQGIEVVTTPNIPPFSMFTPLVKKNIAFDVRYQ